MESKDKDINPDVIIQPTYGYSGNVRLLSFLLGFTPRSIQFFELNPIYNPQISIPALLLSLVLDKYYRKKYFLIKADTLRLFALGVNYFTLYYLIINGIRFYEYSVNYNSNSIATGVIPHPQSPNKI